MAGPASSLDAPRLRVALAVNIPAPYRIPVFRALDETPGLCLRVLFCASREPDRRWEVDTAGLDSEIVRTWSFRGRQDTRGRVAVRAHTTRHLPLGLLAALRRFRPDVVVSLELGARSLLAWLYCRLFGARLVLWTYHSRVSARAAGRLRRELRRWLLARADAVIGMGVQAREVLEELGVDPERLFDAPNAHDHEGCLKALAALDVEAKRQETVEELDSRERIALVAGRLIPLKGLRQLFDAWGRVPEEIRSDWTLLFVGSGPLAGLIQSEAAGRPPGEIAWLPEVPSRELFGYYAASRLLLFPTLSETWGLVVNEAMACGLPVVCSRYAGCADDLLRPGENGWLVDPLEPETFAATLTEALRLSDEEIAGRGELARNTARRFHPQRMADGVLRALRCALSD